MNIGKTWKPQGITAEQIRHWQARCRMTQTQAAHALNVSVETYRGWIWERREPPSMVRQLCRYVERYGVWDPINVRETSAAKAANTTRI